MIDGKSKIKTKATKKSKKILYTLELKFLTLFYIKNRDKIYLSMFKVTFKITKLFLLLIINKDILFSKLCIFNAL